MTYGESLTAAYRAFTHCAYIYRTSLPEKPQPHGPRTSSIPYHLFPVAFSACLPSVPSLQFFFARTAFPHSRGRLLSCIYTGFLPSQTHPSSKLVHTVDSSFRIPPISSHPVHLLIVVLCTPSIIVLCFFFLLLGRSSTFVPSFFQLRPALLRGAGGPPTFFSPCIRASISRLLTERPFCQVSS